MADYFSTANIANRAVNYANNGGSLFSSATSAAASTPQFSVDFLGSQGLGTKIGDVIGSGANNASSGLDWFGNNGVIGSIGTGINAIGNIWNAYNSFTQGRDQLNEMKRANDLAENQYKEETRRYNEQKAEHDAATKAQQDTTGAIYSQFASNYQTPEQKKSVVERD